MRHPSSQYSEAEALDILIFSNRKLEALQLLRSQRGISLAEATESLAARYRQLRAESPDRFTCGDTEYWLGFQS